VAAAAVERDDAVETAGIAMTRRPSVRNQTEPNAHNEPSDQRDAPVTATAAAAAATVISLARTCPSRDVAYVTSQVTKLTNLFALS